MSFYNSSIDYSTFEIPLPSLSPNPHLEFCFFAQGYCNAASQIAENLLQIGSFPDYEAYPVVFLYRHSFELYLKHIIYNAVVLSEAKNIIDIDRNLYNKHVLSELAPKVKTILKKLFPRDKELMEFTQKVEQIAKEFDEIDKGSYCYRYPLNTQGKPSTETKQLVTLRVFHETMKEILDGLDTIDFGMNMELDKLQEMQMYLYDTYTK